MANEIQGGRSGGDRRRRVRCQAGLLLVLPLALLFAGACDGDNLFSESATDLQPRVTSLSVPDAAAGDTARVSVEAYALREVAEIVLSLRGAVTLDTVVAIEPPSTTVAKVIAVGIPSVPPDNQLLVQARAIDTFGKTSRAIQVVAQVN